MPFFSFFHDVSFFPHLSVVSCLILMHFQLKDLEEEWGKLGQGANATQTRFMRSQEELKEKMEAKAEAAGGSGDGMYIATYMCIF